MPTAMGLSPLALLNLLANGEKAVDVIRTSLGIGLLNALEPGGRSLRELSERTGAAPHRLFKFMECLESLGLCTHRAAPDDDIASTLYWPVEGLKEGVIEVFGDGSVEKDRDAYPWRALHGRLEEVLAAELSIPAADFSWPPDGPAQFENFERSMAAGLGPVTDVFRAHGAALWGTGARLLDVGGGDGTLAARLLADSPALTADVYNLPAVRPLFDRVHEASGHGERLGFVAGDFLKEDLPTGYQAMSFVRVLHDWPVAVARQLLAKAYAALPSGGRLLICEEFRDQRRLARQFFWSYFLMGVDGCDSRLYSVDHYRGMLAEAGFSRIEVLPGPFELVAARK
ncbi:methyltransferase [Streptomyces sp. ODS05-4]|uniref:methyltransferase n=1 Tax=Streptomyces sp. ODS05-4 TaxID=2944939 RepID=UPI00210B9BC5|nr:methyltransferase [Streptomyces sp. ODS05-4]